MAAEAEKLGLGGPGSVGLRSGRQGEKLRTRSRDGRDVLTFAIGREFRLVLTRDLPSRDTINHPERPPPPSP